MEKITTTQIINAIKRNIWLIIIPTLLIGGLTFAANFLRGGSYDAEAVLMVTSNDDGPITYNKLILNERLANVYAQFLESDDLYESVATKLNSELDADDIADNLDFTVNPQGGVIAFNYTDSNEARATDTLTLITEEFRAYARDFLNMENIEYLQNVSVRAGSKSRALMFTLGGLIVGFLLGVLLLILKEIFTDKIYKADDIREMDIEVLADISGDSYLEYSKVKRKIETIGDKAVVGLCPANSYTASLGIDQKLAEVMKCPVIDAEKVRASEEGLIDIKYKLNKFGQDYPYILVSESSYDDPLSIDISTLEDYKILIVGGKDFSKSKLKNQIAELKRLGINVLGVIYAK